MTDVLFSEKRAQVTQSRYRLFHPGLRCRAQWNATLQSQIELKLECFAVSKSWPCALTMARCDWLQGMKKPGWTSVAPEWSGRENFYLFPLLPLEAQID